MTKTANRPGWKTTELYMTGGGAITLVETAKSFDNPYIQGVCILGAVACIMAYAFSRGMAKKGA